MKLIKILVLVKFSLQVGRKFQWQPVDGEMCGEAGGGVSCEGFREQDGIRKIAPKTL